MTNYWLEDKSYWTLELTPKGEKKEFVKIKTGYGISYHLKDGDEYAGSWGLSTESFDFDCKDESKRNGTILPSTCNDCEILPHWHETEATCYDWNFEEEMEKAGVKSGDITDVHVGNRALSAGEISDIYAEKVIAESIADILIDICKELGKNLDDFKVEV